MRTTRTTRLFLLLALATATGPAHAGVIQWRNRVPAGEANPDNIGSYTNTIEIGNGGTTGYDNGLDVDLDTSLVLNDNFFVTYVDQDPNKVEYEFTQTLNPGESYTAHLSFENNAGFHFTPNTIEFLAADGDFTYDLKVDTMSGEGNYNHLDSGNVVIGELAPWSKILNSGQDHRNDWFYGELTITNVGEDADFDNNNAVDGHDFLTLQRNLGTGTLHAQGDANGDGMVDADDLGIWETQYGDTVPPLSATSAAVPESTTCTLALAALCLVMSRRR